MPSRARLRNFMNPKRAKVPAIFRLLVDNGDVMSSNYAVIVLVCRLRSCHPAPSLKRAKPLTAIMLLSLGLWHFHLRFKKSVTGSQLVNFTKSIHN